MLLIFFFFLKKLRLWRSFLVYIPKVLEKTHRALMLSQCSRVGAYSRRALIRDVRFILSWTIFTCFLKVKQKLRLEMIDFDMSFFGKLTLILIQIIHQRFILV